MTKAEFKKIAKKCPLYWHDGEPRCDLSPSKNCAKNNCPFAYWLEGVKHGD